MPWTSLARPSTESQLMNRKTRPSAAVVLTRGDGDALEVLLVERNPELRFFGGYWAFPGGVVEGADGTLESGPEAELVALTACARRELAEEVGVALDDSIAELCSITTPPFAPVRYETRFFHAQLPAGQEPSVCDDELTDCRFWRPAEALQEWRQGNVLIVPPVLLMLERMRSGALGDMLAEIRAEAQELARGKLHPVRFSPGILLAPLQTATKPPATTTNTLLVGEEQFYVVDPGTQDAAEYARLRRMIDEYLALGRSLEGILLTHHHPDHVGSVGALSQDYGATVLAHEITLERIPRDYVRAEVLTDGDRIPLGHSPDGAEDWHLQVHHTPGHAVDHLAFHESRYQTLVAGDLCSVLSTMVIDPPEGHLATYLMSLERMAELPISTIYPAHGPAQRDGNRMLRHLIAHRLKREGRLRAALSGEWQSVAELLVVVYDDTDPKLHALAERSMVAHLLKLEEEGFVVGSDECWRLSTDA